MNLSPIALSVPDQSDRLPRRRDLSLVRQESPYRVLSATATSNPWTFHRSPSRWNSLTFGVAVCSAIAEEAHALKRIVPRAISFALCRVGRVVRFNSAALTLNLSFNCDTVQQTSAASDPVTPVIGDNLGTWAEPPFLAIVGLGFLACESSMVPYTSHIRFPMARVGCTPAILSQVIATEAPQNTVLLAALGLPFGLNEEAMVRVLAFGTGGLYAMFAMIAGVRRYTRLTGLWDLSLGQLKLGLWRSFTNTAAFLLSDAPWCQFWAVPRVLGSILALTYAVCPRWEERGNGPSRKGRTKLKYGRRVVRQVLCRTEDSIESDLFI